MQPLEFLDVRLKELREAGLLRVPATGAEHQALRARAKTRGRRLIDVSSNDYLGLAGTPVSRETLDACSGSPAGAGASRLLGGTLAPHDELEAAVADWVRLPAALLFASGYAANLGTIAALFGPGDLVVSDALNHASLVDGCRLSRARVAIVPHLDLSAVEASLRDAPERHRAVVTESYFSMDADTPDLRGLRDICHRYSAALLVDEAHALGVFGPGGAGLCAAIGVLPDVLIGTLGKAVGTQGAFVAAHPPVRTWLWNRARSFVFSTAVSPLMALLTAARLAEVRAAEDTRVQLHRASASLRATLLAQGLPLAPASHGPVLPIILGRPEDALRAARRLAGSDVWALPIRPPTVPHGTSRLRVTLTAQLTTEDLTRLASALVDACA